MPLLFRLYTAIPLNTPASSGNKNLMNRQRRELAGPCMPLNNISMQHWKHYTGWMNVFWCEGQWHFAPFLNNTRSGVRGASWRTGPFSRTPITHGGKWCLHLSREAWSCSLRKTKHHRCFVCSPLMLWVLKKKWTEKIEWNFLHKNKIRGGPKIKGKSIIIISAKLIFSTDGNWWKWMYNLSSEINRLFHISLVAPVMKTCVLKPFHGIQTLLSTERE